MKLGISIALPHSSPEEWALKNKEMGLEAVLLPCGYNEPVSRIDAYVRAASDAGLCIAEVGAWSDPLSPDPKKAADAFTHCCRSLELAEYVGACCCVNIAGSRGEIWDGSYPENYSEQTYTALVECLQRIIDSVRPKRTAYTLEPMPNMHPDSPEDYLRLIRDVDRESFAVHLDLVNLLVSPRVFCEQRQLVDRCFSLLGGRIRSCHLKDAVLDSKLTVSIRETECGTGGVDLAYYIRKADETNRDLPMLLEHLPTEDSYVRSVETVRRILAKNDI